MCLAGFGTLSLCKKARMDLVGQLIVLATGI